jgi:putative ABC transport system permease protein
METMGFELLDGRNFMAGDKDQACIMNEEAVKRYGWDNIEGKKFNNGREGGYKVVGVVNNFNVESLHAGITPVALIYEPSRKFNTLSLRLMPGNVGQQIEQLRKVWKEILPDDPMEFTFYNDQFQAMYVKEEKLAKSVTFFSLIAIVLTCMGILGQIFLISLNRTKEIGVRKVNGAKESEILILLNKDFVIWVVVAFIIATPIAYYAMNKWLENFAYKTELSWWIFALAGLLALGIALLTVSWQSWRAATRNPVEVLRYE